MLYILFQGITIKITVYTTYINIERNPLNDEINVSKNDNYFNMNINSSSNRQ